MYMRRIITQDEKDGMINLYINGDSAQKAASVYGLSSECCTREAKKRGIKIKNNSRYTIDDSIFEKIDTEDKAYWLGFIAADGNVTDYGGLNIGLKKSDLLHLEKFKKFCGSSHPIKICRSSPSFEGGDNSKIFESCRIVIGNRKICNDLAKFGILPRKSFSFIPTLDLISEDLHRHFWRGVFDGDGCISKTLEPKYKNSWVWTINLVGNRPVIEKFQEYIFSYSKCRAKIISKYGECDKETCCISSAGVELVQNILRPIYSNANIYLDRKYKLYLECAAQTILRKKRSDITVEQIRDLFDKHRTWRGVAKELKTSTGRLYLIREGLGMIDSQNRKKKEKEGAE